jgi:hypothetical protein
MMSDCGIERLQSITVDKKFALFSCVVDGRSVSQIISSANWNSFHPLSLYNHPLPGVFQANKKVSHQIAEDLFQYFLANGVR